MTKKRLAIIGNGMAAGRLLDELVRRNATASFEITVFGEEPRGSYNRILLGRVLSGGDPDEITLKPTEWYASTRRGVPLRRARHEGRSGRAQAHHERRATFTLTTWACSPPAARRSCRRCAG